MQAASDAAVALAGVDGLRALVTDWDFEEAGFADCVGPALELLARLLQGSAEFDTQLQARQAYACGLVRRDMWGLRTSWPRGCCRDGAQVDIRQ